MLALGIAGLLAGLGVVCTVMGAAFIWESKRRYGFTAPDTTRGRSRGGFGEQASDETSLIYVPPSSNRRRG